MPLPNDESDRPKHEPPKPEDPEAAIVRCLGQVAEFVGAHPDHPNAPQLLGVLANLYQHARATAAWHAAQAGPPPALYVPPGGQN